MPDVGVFIDAHHLLDVDRNARPAVRLLERIEVVAAQLALGSGLSHRVIAADCADSAARSVAEDFGLRGGFRMRHCPTTHGIDVAAVLSSEIYEATRVESMRTVVVVASPRPYLPIFDVLHREGRLVITLTTSRGEPSVAELAVELDLDLSHLAGLVTDALQTLEAQQFPASEAALQTVLRRLQPDFAPRNYGFRTFGQALEKLSDVIRRAPDGTYRSTVTPARSADRPLTDHGRGGVAGVTSQNASRLCAPLAAERSDLQGFADAMREVVERLVEEPEFRAVAGATGLPLTVVGAGLRAAAPNYVKSSGNKASRLFELAGLGVDWLLVRNMRSSPDLRCVHGRIPEGFELVLTSNGKIDEDEPEVSAKGNESDEIAASDGAPD